MATFTVTFKTLIGNYAVLQTLTNSEIAVGQSITVAGVAVPFNGTQTVYALPLYEFIGIDSEGDLLFDSNVSIPNQVLFAVTGTTDVDRTASTGGTISYSSDTPATCTVDAGTGAATLSGQAAGDCTVKAVSSLGATGTQVVTVTTKILDTVTCLPGAPKAGDVFGESIGQRSNAYGFARVNSSYQSAGYDTAPDIG